MLNRTSVRFNILSTAIGMAVMAVGCATPARAQLSFVDMFRNGASEQTGNGNSLSLNGYFLSLDLNATSAGDFTSANVAGPGPVSPPLTLSGTTDFHYQTTLYASQAAMDSDFPVGSYQFNGVGGNFGPQTATLDYSSDTYPGQTPYLTGTDYSALQGLNAHSAITLHFSPFATDASANAQYRFFTIFDVTTNTLVVDDAFLPNTTSTVTIAANTLTPGDSYSYEIDDSNRVNTTGSGGTFTPLIGFDLRADGTFTTAPNAVPEPGIFALFAGLGLTVGLLWSKRGLRSKR